MILSLQALQLVHVEGRKAVLLGGAQVAAGALHPEHFRLLSGQRILFRDL